MTSELNFSLWAVPIAIAANVALAMIWYLPPVFGTAWSALTGQSVGGPPQPVKLLVGAVCSVVFVSCLAWLFQATGVSRLTEAATLAAVVGVGLIVAVALPIHVYNGQPMRLLLIDTGLTVVALVVDVGLLYAFRIVPSGG